jgi:hypothetical protein
MFGCKVGDLKPIAKSIRGNQELALELYSSGNSDAMYLAGMVASGAKMTKLQLQSWVDGASWYMTSEHTVPGVTCEHPDAWSIGLKWINSKKESIAASGWCVLSGVLATRDDQGLDLSMTKILLDRIGSNIHLEKNRVRYTMNGFVISVGSYVDKLLNDAKRTAKAIGKIDVEMGDTACKVPLAIDYISKLEKLGRIGKKRKTMKC